MEAVEILLWLCAFVLALLMAALMVLRIVGRAPDRWVTAGGYASALLYCLAGAAALNWAAVHGGTFVMPLRVGILLLTTGLTIAHIVMVRVLVGGLSLLGLSRRTPTPRLPIALGLGGAYALLAAVAASQFYAAARGTADGQLSGFAPRFEVIQDFILRTDKGRTFPAYRAFLPQGHDETAADAPARLLDGYLIREGPIDTRSNCHGWLFAQGECVVMGDAVEAILQDNGYQLVTNPAPGDIIVYRDEHGVIMHSGLVRGILDDGTPLIESKWGLGARYLHRPMDQIFSPHFSYYRSPRRAELADTRARHTIEIVLTNTYRIDSQEIGSAASTPPGSSPGPTAPASAAGGPPKGL
ncbi:MAG: hypothetical protein KatS3mg110_1737 [Pirellulaceae bacterium]|nr:MAG: hypothetical protein KatS3mg110_1737 [Pirellulaceae bacterium]